MVQQCICTKMITINIDEAVSVAETEWNAGEVTVVHAIVTLDARQVAHLATMQLTFTTDVITVFT